MLLLVQYTLIFASVLILVALGGCFSEHSGVINLGLEGIMVIGSLGGALMMRYAPEGISSFGMVIFVLLAAILSGVVYSMLFPGNFLHFAEPLIAPFDDLRDAEAEDEQKCDNDPCHHDRLRDRDPVTYRNRKDGFDLELLDQLGGE